MGSVDIPPFLREQQKQKVQATGDVPPFLKKKEEEIVAPVSSGPSLSASASVGDGTVSTPPSTSQLPLAPAGPVESPFEFNKYRDKKIAIPANIPRTTAEVSKVLSKVENGYVDKSELSDLYNTDYGKPIVEQLIDKYAPELGKMGWDKEVFRNEEKWDDLSKAIKTKNRTNAAIQQENYIKSVDEKLQDAFANLKTTKISVTGGTGGAAVNENILSLPAININNPWEYGRVIEQLKSSDDVVDASGNRVPGKKQELIDYLDQKAKYFTAKQGVDQDVLTLGSKVTDAIARSNIQRELGEDIPTGEFAKNDKLNEEHFKIGLSYLKNVKPGQYKNVLRVIDEGKQLPDDDFREIAEVGQEIYNQQVFFGAATNPELIDKETNLDYTTYTDKKAQYAAVIGERLKEAGGTNRMEFSEAEIKRAAFDLPNKKIVQDLANEEKIFGYDAIPKSGAIEALVQGINQPIDGIKSTFELFSESPAETYIRSKKLDTGSAQKVVGPDGQVSGVLPSDRGNIYYDAIRGLGQFIPQVLLTKGIGGATANVIASDARIALTPVLKQGISTYGGTAISTFLQSYGDSYADYLQKTGDPATARLGGTIDGGVAAAFELLLPDVKIADKALAGLKSGLSTDIIDLVKKGGDPAALAAKARPFVQKFVTNTINIAGQEIAEEDGTALVDFITESIFSPQTAKDRDLGKELLETTKATAVSMAIPSLLGGAGSSVNQDFTRNAFNSASINFDDYRQALDKQLNNGGITQTDYNTAIKLLSTHRESISAAPKQNINGAEIDGQKQLEYAYEDTKIKVYKEKAENSSGVAKEMWESKIQQSEDIQRAIVMPKKTEFEARFPDLVAEDIVVDESKNILSPQETITKAVNDEVLTGVEADLIKQGVATPDDILLSLAKQKYGVSEDGSLFPEGGRDISMKTSLDVDEAVEKVYPNQQSVIDAINNPFKESKVPQVVYRASTGGKFGEGKAIHFTSNKKYAESYSEDMQGNKIGEVKAHYVDLRNPLIVSMQNDYKELANGKMIENAKRDGYDGIIAKDESGTVDEIVVFDSSKIQQQSTPTNKSKTTSVIRPEQNKTPDVVPLVQSKVPVVDLGTRVQTTEPPAAEGITPVTLSGLTESERQQQIQKRQSETSLTDQKKQTNALLEKVKSYNSLPKGRLGKQKPAGLQKLNDIRLEAQRLGYTFDERSGTLRNELNRTVRPDNRAIGDRAIAPNGVPLRERSQQTQDVFNQLFEAGNFPNGYRLDNKQMSSADLDGAIQDILDGIPSERANNYLNQLEKYIAADRFEIGNPGELKQAPSLNELLGVQPETQSEPMTQEALESWLNEQGALTPQQEQVVIDNIENLIQDYEPATTTEGVVQPTQPTTETASSPAVEQNTEPISTPSEAAPVAQAPATQRQGDTVEALTNELRSLLGNTALPYDVKNTVEISQDSRGKYFVTDVNSKEPVSPAFDTREQAQSFIDEMAKPLPFAGDTNPKNRVSFQDLGVTESDTIESFVDKLIAYGGQFTTIFNLIKADPNFQRIKLQLVNSRSGLENGESGLYYPVGYGEGMDSTLQIANKDNVYYTAAHELMHFMTLDSDTANQIKSTPAYKALTDLYNYIVDKKGKPVAIAGGATLENYGLTNEKEFMAELLINPTFRKYVMDVFATNRDDIFKASKAVRDSKVNSIGDIILNFFKDIFDKLFSRGTPDVPFNEKFPVVMNAAKLATDLFFGGQDIISTQPSFENEQGGTVLSLPTGETRAAALAFPSTNRDEQINTFVKSALDRGVNEADLKQALINNGISEADAQAFIDANKAAPAPQPAAPVRSDNDIISTVLSQRIDARTFPSIFQGNESDQQIAATTQGAGQNREVDGPYVVALEKDLKEVSVQSAKVLRDELGKDWGVKTLEWIEKHPSQGNLAQVVGILNIISTDNYHEIQDTHDGNRARKLTAIQKRIDVVALQRARDASLALRQRILYAQFAQGESMIDTLANAILSPELQQLQSDMNEALSTQPTDAELNKATPIKIKPTKKKSAIRNITSAAKRKSNPAIKDELISKGADTANKTQKSFKELIEDAKNKLKNNKC